jgi:uncharacterized protein YndB with AHSA1/START domain
METIAAALGLMTRTVSTVEVDGRPARRTLMSRSFPTDADDLWDALTNPQRIPRWFLPIEGDLRVGGTYQLEGNAGGTIEECEPPDRFRVTWVMADAPTWLAVTLRPNGSATLLELEHFGQVPEERWAQFGPSATGIGWDMTLHGLAMHLSSGADNDPAEFVAWATSPEGVTFIQTSAEHWQSADVAAGASPDEAVARAQRTVAFYTGQTESPQA